MDIKLKRLLDEAAIRYCMARYARGVDRMDRALIEGAYWEDGYDRHALSRGARASSPTGFWGSLPMTNRHRTC